MMFERVYYIVDSFFKYSFGSSIFIFTYKIKSIWYFNFHLLNPFLFSKIMIPNSIYHFSTPYPTITTYNRWIIEKQYICWYNSFSIQYLLCQFQRFFGRLIIDTPITYWAKLILLEYYPF